MKASNRGYLSKTLMVGLLSVSLSGVSALSTTMLVNSNPMAIHADLSNGIGTTKTELKQLINKSKLILSHTEHLDISYITPITKYQKAAQKVYDDKSATKAQIYTAWHNLQLPTSRFNDDGTMGDYEENNNSVDIGGEGATQDSKDGGDNTVNTGDNATDNSHVDPIKDADTSNVPNKVNNNKDKGNSASTGSSSTNYGNQQTNTTVTKVKHPKRSNQDTGMVSKTSASRGTDNESKQLDRHTNTGIAHSSKVDGNRDTTNNPGTTTNSSSNVAKGSRKGNLPTTGEQWRQTMVASILGVLVAFGLGGTGLAMWLRKHSKVDKG